MSPGPAVARVELGLRSHLSVVHVLRVAACGGGGGSLACACAPSSMSLQDTAQLTEGRSDMPGAQTHTFHCRQVAADGG